MAKNDKRPIIKLKSTAGTGYTYVTRKNRTNTRERIELKKYDPVVRQHVVFRERALSWPAFQPQRRRASLPGSPVSRPGRGSRSCVVLATTSTPDQPTANPSSRQTVSARCHRILTRYSQPLRRKYQ